MPNLTAHYRNDDAQGLPTDIKDYLDQHYLQHLDNLAVAHPKLLVAFSGGNAMGKTTLSLKIGQELQGLVLENDAIKECLLQMDPQLDRDTRNKLTWQYSMDLYSRLANLTPNGLVIRDGLIDWYYDRILPVFAALHYDLFVIGYDVSRAKNEELIRKRGDKPTITVERMLRLRDEQELHMSRFRSTYTPDIMLTDETLFDHDRVIAAVQERLTQLS